jgi:HEAT repeat protein
MEPENTLEQTLENWRQGRTSVEQTRELSRELGNKQYSPGIPVLVQFLDNQDEIVRYNAATALGFELHHKPAAEKLLAMLVGDSDEDCRRAAAAGLGNLCQNSKNRRVLEALAQAALNDPDEYVRSSAYQALQIVNGVSREEHLALLQNQSLLVDPARVNIVLAEISASSKPKP